MIFNIQKCSIHDGNGLRTIVFFKGCPLRCPWCANPESQSYDREIMEMPRACIGCGSCATVCPGAITLTAGQMKIDRDKCIKCFKCTDVCFAESKKVVGYESDVKEIFSEVYKDRLFYQQFGGGVTISGGEPLSQPELLTELAAECSRHKINVTVETCGYGDYRLFKEALRYIDFFFIDIKHMDDSVHKKLTGVSNRKILENIKNIAGHGIPITIRTPIVPGYNDTPQNIAAIAKFIKDIPSVEEYELLPYHNLGESKYHSLGRSYKLENVSSPDDSEISDLVRIANNILRPHGKQCFYTKKNKKEIIL